MELSKNFSVWGFEICKLYNLLEKIHDYVDDNNNNNNSNNYSSTSSIISSIIIIFFFYIRVMKIMSAEYGIIYKFFSLFLFFLFFWHCFM